MHPGYACCMQEWTHCRWCAKNGLTAGGVLLIGCLQGRTNVATAGSLAGHLISSSARPALILYAKARAIEAGATGLTTIPRAAKSIGTH